ncbi:MAG: STAS domain-containing protein [Chloroflexota bacterium]
MTEPSLNLTVRKLPGIGIVDVDGDITGSAEDVLTAAYNEAVSGNTKAFVLNFSELDYMNSTGIGLLVTLLIRAQRQNHALLAYGLSNHYREIFQLTRLDEAIGIYDSEAAVMAALSTTPAVGS